MHNRKINPIGKSSRGDDRLGAAQELSKLLLLVFEFVVV
jgi:hypothetical protein